MCRYSMWKKQPPFFFLVGFFTPPFLPFFAFAFARAGVSFCLLASVHM